MHSLNSAYYDDSVTLVISIDKSNTDVVEKYAYSLEWEHGNKRVITHSFNLGLRRHVLECGNLLSEFDALIVLEDDVSVSESFYLYAKQCVEKYSNDDRIAGISLYSFHYNYQNSYPFSPLHDKYDVYFMNCAQSWGQVWMKRQWFKFKEWYELNSDIFLDLNGIPDVLRQWPDSSWLKYHTAYCICNNKYFIYPYCSLSTNNSDMGTHVKVDRFTMTQVEMLRGKKEIFYLPDLEEKSIQYDGFFENKNIFQDLGISQYDICVDFYGTKRNEEHKRYWLTRKHANYKILSSYSLSLKPYEYNIINKVKGDDLYLYDTKTIVCNIFSDKSPNLNFIAYLYNINIISTIAKVPLREILMYVWRKLFR